MRKNLKATWRRELLALAGTLIYCLGINMFVVPAGLYSSGLLGLCQVLRTVLEQYLHISFGTLDISGLIYYVVNIPILLVALSQYELPLLRQTIHEHDPDAFLIMKDHVKIYGNYDKKL